MRACPERSLRRVALPVVSGAAPMMWLNKRYKTVKALLHGYYATRIHLPISGVARSWRRFSRRVRNKEGGLLQQVALPGISWRACTGRRLVGIWGGERS